MVYLDPPWQGTSGRKDTRYHQILDLPRLIRQLDDLNRRGVPFLLSFDGSLGSKAYGETLPAELDLARLELPAGRSAQATLSGSTDETVESLYVSRNIVARLESRRLALERGGRLHLDQKGVARAVVQRVGDGVQARAGPGPRRARRTT